MAFSKKKKKTDGAGEHRGFFGAVGRAARGVVGFLAEVVVSVLVDWAGKPTKTCPDCAETIPESARVCRYCGYRFEPPA